MISSTVEKEFRALQFGHFSLSKYGIPPRNADINIVTKLRPIANRMSKSIILPSLIRNLPINESIIKVMIAVTRIFVDFFIALFNYTVYECCCHFGIESCHSQALYIWGDIRPNESNAGIFMETVH
jgi:hypothetical protein